jgi:UDP-glucose 4-epimerase
VEKRKLGKILVTGADGFIGSHLTEELVARGFDTTALCLYNSDGKFGWLNELAEKKNKNLKFVLGDVRDAFQMNEVSKGIDTIFHLAALIAIPYSYAAPQSYVDTNINGTLNLLEAVKNNGVSRMIHTSTSEVYGTAQIVPISETHPLQGQSPYSATKISADMLSESYFRSFGVPVCTLRPFNTFGPRQSYRAVIPTVIGQILAGAKEIKLGSILPTRDFNFVSNTTNAFISLGEADEQVLGEVYNAGSGREIDIGSLVHLIADILGKKVSIIQENERLRPDNSEVERLLADSEKLMNKTGWRPVTSLEEGLAKTISWQKEKSSFLQALQYQR